MSVQGQGRFESVARLYPTADSVYCEDKITRNEGICRANLLSTTTRKMRVEETLIEQTYIIYQYLTAPLRFEDRLSIFML